METIIGVGPAKDAPSQLRRPKVVCVQCHVKKIKCDLESRIGLPNAKCTKCFLDGHECCSRVSKRGTGPRKRNHINVQHARFDSSNNGVQVGARQQRSDSTASNVPSVPLFQSTATSAPTWPTSIAQSLPEPDPQEMTVEVIGNRGQSAIPAPSEPLLSQCSPASSRKANHDYLGESGYMGILSGDLEADPEVQQAFEHLPRPKAFDFATPALQRSFIETFFEYCYPWCPVIDPGMLTGDGLIAKSALLKQAMAVVGSHISPPILNRVDSKVYYERARVLFNEGYEKDPLICVAAVSLFYWSGHGLPNTFSMDTVFWWTGIAIRIAQQCRLHRELKEGQKLKQHETPGLRRRIFWTLFARERITAIAQGRPCMIDTEDCDVKPPCLEDFPAPVDSRAVIFINWVALCGVIGRVGKQLQRAPRSPQVQFPLPLALELVDWVKNLPPHLQLSIGSETGLAFNRDVHQLHLPYLTTIILVHLGESPRPVPTAHTAAVLAATCVARIFTDLLHREHIRFLPAVCSWYIAIAILALLHARQVDSLSKHAAADMHILQTALKELSSTRQSSRMIQQGVERLLAEQQNSPVAVEGIENSPSLQVKSSLPAFTEFLPYVTAQTSLLASCVLLRSQDVTFPGFSSFDWTDDFINQLQGLREDPLDFDMDMFCEAP